MIINLKYDPSRITNAMKEVWGVLTPSQQNLFLKYMQVQKYRKNELIYRQGESPQNLLCLISGKVKIYSEGDESGSLGIGGRCIINRVLRPVQYFGYRAFIAGGPYVTAAAAFEEATVVAIPMQVVEEVLSVNVSLCRFFMKHLAVDLGMADCRVVSLTQKHVRGRLADTLLSLYNIYGVESDGVTLNLKISREDIAGLSNMTTSNAIRTLSNFKDEGVVEICGKQIRLLSVSELQRISRHG